MSLEGFTADQLNRTFEEVFKQTDRASAIVSSALLEELLERLVLAFLIDHQSAKRDLLDGMTLLSTMSAKINLAYYLGLLEQSEFEDLKLIKNIRNDFAHSFETISFETQRIKDKCLQLKMLISTHPAKVLMDNMKKTKMFYQVNTTLLASKLFMQLDQVEHLGPYRYKQKDGDKTANDEKDR
jgi:DNA-binding MltR family transcriptional regulator